MLRVILESETVEKADEKIQFKSDEKKADEEKTREGTAGEDQLAREMPEDQLAKQKTEDQSQGTVEFSFWQGGQKRKLQADDVDDGKAGRPAQRERSWNASSFRLSTLPGPDTAAASVRAWPLT